MVCESLFLDSMMGDMAQLVDERVTLVNTMSGETLDIEAREANSACAPTAKSAIISR